MIDLDHEDLVGLADAAKHLAERFQSTGRKVHTSTVWRWASKGVGGVVLESVKFGGARVTSKQALARFFDALGRNGRAEPADSQQPSLPTSPSDKRARQRRAAAADKELEKLGI